MISGRVFVITFAFILIGAAVGSTLVMMNNSGKARGNQSGSGLVNVGRASSIWATTHDGEYPAHIALLRKGRYFDPKWLDDPRDLPRSVWTVGGVDARPFMEEEVNLANADAGASVSQPLDRTPLLEAVAREIAARESSIYFFGEYWLVQLPKHVENAAIIFGWSQPDDDGRRFVAFDNGEVRRIEDKEWRTIWDADARARAELGWDEIHTE